jgi:hypothetical protein
MIKCHQHNKCVVIERAQFFWAYKLNDSVSNRLIFGPYTPGSREPRTRCRLGYTSDKNSFHSYLFDLANSDPRFQPNHDHLSSIPGIKGVIPIDLHHQF